MSSLAGKTAIVTGSTRGIGKGIAVRYGREGANVVVSGTNAELCEEVAASIRQEGGSAIGIPCDISKLEDINRLYDKTLDTFGEINIVVNNAGIAVFKPFVEVDPETVRSIWNVNLFGTFFSGQRAAKEMIRQGKGGKIINMSSISEEVGTEDLTQYAMTKGAIKIMTKCMALELAKHRINVNAIGAGVIDTDISADEFAKPGMREATIQRIPWGRMGSPEDIAGTAVFLAGSDSEYLTGTTVFVDGGLIAM
ncbi:SDR family oxidoreductase [Paenibacillus sp. MZ04-78.2]|uniref:SDR family NAD(P)-dependent oxidoreductase n=1 Tax=Paenibacillus sp. MZ04-78.2 TaxID=2962034 RepID=UPI0020B67BB7|nr:SDR family oxidoreductase [Paenibacillus sp. MZ04-78.2]MCP3775769.1 SDR family oxidoreductase [Paenibacillus sp. MZ04-78.2]